MESEPEQKDELDTLSLVIKDGWQIDLAFVGLKGLREELYYTHSCKDGKLGAAISVDGVIQCRSCKTPVHEMARISAFLYRLRNGAKE